MFISLADHLSTKNTFFAMSDRPTNDLKFKDLVIAVRGVVEWHDLGLQLDLPESSLKLIATHPDIEGHLRMMLSEWLQYDPEATWEKLATALSKIGKNAIAANVRQQFVSGTPAQSLEQEARRCTYYYTEIKLYQIYADLNDFDSTIHFVFPQALDLLYYICTGLSL